MRFNVKALAITCAVLWGLALFLITWWLILLEGASGDTTLIGRVYVGYTVSPIGSVIGLLWGLVDGFIGGAIFGWAYNFFARVSQKTA